MKKALWATDTDIDALLDKALFIGASIVCIRTTNSQLAKSIPKMQAKGLKVYGWRWPSIQPIDAAKDKSHWFAPNEAKYVSTLIDAGLDGYIVDPECDGDRAADCWNSPTLSKLAIEFCGAVKVAGRKKNRNFFFGLTSGGQYPDKNNHPQIPWAEFVAHSDAVFPQSYWVDDANRLNGGTPSSAFDECIPIWQTICPDRMEIVPMVGEIRYTTPSEIAAYQSIIDKHKISELHFYVFDQNVPQSHWDAIRLLRAPPEMEAVAALAIRSALTSVESVNYDKMKTLVARDESERVANSIVPPGTLPIYTGGDRAADATTFDVRIANAAKAEWDYFLNRTWHIDGKVSGPPSLEAISPWAERIATYWERIGEHWTGRTNEPWSAAFISWCVYQAGAAERFAYNKAHAEYIHWAIRNKLDNKPTAPFVGLKLKDTPLQRGDIVGGSRNGAHISYEAAAKTTGFDAHCDIVIEVTPRLVKTIGGNVTDTVTLTERAVTADGRLKLQGEWFVVIRAQF